MSKKNQLLPFLLIISLLSSGQTIGKFTFANLPQDYQLYPRSANNLATINIKAKTVSTSNLGLFLYRNNQLKQVLKPSPSNGLFTFTLTIPAELAEYDMSFYAFDGKDSSLVVKKSNLVCGDVILVSGQSNARIGPMDKYVYQGEWLRTYGKNKVKNTDLSESYEIADTLWNTQKLNLNLDPIESDYMKLGLGPFSSELARVLIEELKFPIAIISNAQSSTSIDFHLNMKGDLIAPKGGDMLYYKVFKAGLLNDIKTIVFIQGESEMINKLANTWIDKFATLRNKWKSYFPNLLKVAVPQLNIYQFRSPNSATLRNDQRNLQLLPDIITWASVGNEGFDGLHYFGTEYLKESGNLYLFENKGYRQMANEVGRLLLKNLYQKNLPNQVQSPNIQKAYFPDADTRNKVILEFDEGQVIKFSKDTTVKDNLGNLVKHELKYNFFYDRFNQSSMGPYITNIFSLTSNKIMLEFNVNYEGNTISYLPEFHGNYDIGDYKYPFPGPFLKNELGMRAFSFSNIIIDEQKTYSNEFKLFPNPSTDWIELRWPSTIKGTIELVDITGKLIMTRNVENTRIVDVNLNDYPIRPGKYFIKFISSEGGFSSKPVIKY